MSNRKHEKDLFSFRDQLEKKIANSKYQIAEIMKFKIYVGNKCQKMSNQLITVLNEAEYCVT